MKSKFLTKIINKILLSFPFLYNTKFLNYETRLGKEGIQDLLKILKEIIHLEGNIIECGSYKCGTTIIIANYLESKRIKKTIFACDSYEGFDVKELEKEKKEGLTSAKKNEFTSTSFDYVKNKIKKLKLENEIIPIKGYFQNTLKHINSKFCLILIDADLKDSIIYSVQSLWNSLVSQGYILIDDYLSEKYKGAKLAIEWVLKNYKDEISAHGLLNRLYFIKKR